MWRQKAGSAAPRLLAGVSALVLTAVALYSATVAVLPQHGLGIAIRIWLLLGFMILAALSSWMLVVGQESLLVRVATNLSCGFNLIWIFSYLDRRWWWRACWPPALPRSRLRVASSQY